MFRSKLNLGYDYQHYVIPCCEHCMYFEGYVSGTIFCGICGLNHNGKICDDYKLRWWFE